MLATLDITGNQLVCCTKQRRNKQNNQRKSVLTFQARYFPRNLNKTVLSFY